MCVLQAGCHGEGSTVWCSVCLNSSQFGLLCPVLELSHQPIQVIVQHLIWLPWQQVNKTSQQKKGQLSYCSSSHALQCFVQYLVISLIGFDAVHQYAKLEPTTRDSACQGSVLKLKLLVLLYTCSYFLCKLEEICVRFSREIPTFFILL